MGPGCKFNYCILSISFIFKQRKMRVTATDDLTILFQHSLIAQSVQASVRCHQVSLLLGIIKIRKPNSKSVLECPRLSEKGLTVPEKF